MSPFAENFVKIYSEMVQFGAYFTLKLPDLYSNNLICSDDNKNPMGSLIQGAAAATRRVESSEEVTVTTAKGSSSSK